MSFFAFFGPTVIITKKKRGRVVSLASPHNKVGQRASFEFFICLC